MGLIEPCKDYNGFEGTMIIMGLMKPCKDYNGFDGTM